MAIVYYPKDSIILRRDTISASYEQLELDLIPNAIFYFGPNLTALTNSLLQVTSSWSNSSSYAITASYSLNGGSGGTSLITGSTYPITSSWAELSTTSSFASSAHESFSSSYSITSLTSDFALIAGTSITSTTASYVRTGSRAITASYADIAGNSGTTLNTGSTYPITSSWSNESKTASYYNQLWLNTGSNYPITTSWSNTSLISNNTLFSSQSVSSSYASSSVSSSYSLTASYALNTGNGTILETGSTYPITSSWSSVSLSSSYLNQGANIYLSQSYISSVVGSTNPPFQSASMFWNDNTKTYAIYTDHEGVTLQLGQENWVRGYAGENIYNGQAVYITSSLGELPIFKLALADAIETSNKSFLVGLATENIPSGSIGVVTSHGQVYDIDTSAYVPGQTLFLSSVNSGSLVGIAITDPYNIVSIGNVVVSDVTNGIIQVNISNIGSYDYPAIGPVYVPTITNLGGSTFSVGTCSVNFCTTAEGTGHIYSYLMPTASFTITSSFLDVQYLIANYGSGSTYWSVSTDYHNLNTFQTAVVATFTVGTSGNISWVDWDSSGVTLSNKLLHRIVDLYGAQRSSGLMLGTSGSHITITRGNGFLGIKELTFSTASTSNNNSFVLLSHSASVWSGSFVNGWVNDRVDNGTNTVSIGTNKYVVNYVWRGIGNLNRSQVLLSPEYTNYADAVAAIMPDYPSELPNIAIFCGRIIAQNGNGILLVESAFNTILSVAGVTSHNDLLGLQGGQSGEYYHLTSASYSQLIGGGSGFLTTGSTYNITSSWAVTASYALTGGNGGATLTTGSTYPITSSWALNVNSSSYALTASYSLISSPSISASYASTSSTVVGQNTNTLWIPAAAMTVNTTSGSTAGTLEYGTDRVMLNYQSFAKTSQQTAQFVISMPKTWDVGTVTGQFVWTTAFTGSAATGSVVWAIGGGSVSQNDNLNFTFGTTQSVVASTGIGSAYTASYFHYTSSRLSAVTIGGSPQAEDTIWFKVYRNSLHSSDTLSGSAALLGIKLLIGTTAINDL